ncbi:MAG: M28 family peptidase, partial [Candidatus Acidiferrales bacterium]
GGAWTPALRLASWEAMPITLAQDSESADVTADLVDVGNGTQESDYVGKDVRGKIVLAAAQPGPVARLAVERYGAAGIVSYAQNQRTAWWGENENLVRWGHLDSFSSTPTFAFMVSLKQARAFQQRLVGGERIRLHAIVRAGRHPGFYDIVTATLPGADPQRRQEEIAFSCHLDHQRPGANDNASGCVTILEVARTLAKLVREGKLPPLARTLRFIWPPEIEGTVTLLNARPELAAHIKAVVHMDMVGGGPETKAIFHITRGPASLPSFINDVAEAFGEFVNQQSAAFAGGSRVPYPLVAPEGGKEAWLAEFAEFSQGSDHQVYTDSSFGIPAIYLNDWPDRYIHTNFDSPANIDPTKLKRAGFIGAAAAFFLANAGERDAEALWQILQQRSLRRTATVLARRAELDAAEAANLTRFHLWHERALADSMERFFPVPDGVRQQAAAFFAELEKMLGAMAPPEPGSGDGALVFRRNSQLKGPLSVFGYDYLADHYGEARTAGLRLLRFEGRRGSGGEYAYEVLNFVDGRRTAQEIRDAVAAIYGPVPMDIVAEYLRALETSGVVQRAN